MARSLSSLLVLVLATSALGGCGILKKKQPDGAPSSSPVAVTPPPTTPPAAPPAPAPEPVVAVADEAVATPEDFEDEAFSKVSDKTYKAELETLKKAIEAK